MSDQQKQKDDSPNNNNNTSSSSTIVNHILFPAVTHDYRVTRGKFGYQLVANRRIPKGSRVMTDSLEFLFSDVQEGDCLWFANYHEEAAASKLASGGGSDGGGGSDNGSSSSSSGVPMYLPVTRDMLFYTHGLYQIQKQSSEEVVVSSYLEVPGMLMDHSCDPSIIAGNDGEDIAARDLEVGDEITVDYAICDFDEPPIPECSCGAANCRGKAIAFNHIMNKADQERILPQLMPATRAEYLHAHGKGPRVREEEIVHPPRSMHMMPSTTSNSSMNRNVMRLVCPGPSTAETKVMVKKCISDDNVDGRIDSIHEYGLYATEDFSKGQMLYYFWSQNWPDEDTVIDMVFAAPLQEKGDDKEGTVIRLDPHKCGAYRNANGQLTFSAWQLLTAHSCDPNIVYMNKEKLEGDNWQRVVAAKDIKKGDRLSVDWNCFIWDLDSDNSTAVCRCGVPNCTGTKQGFKHLSSKAQKERLEMTWLHEAAAPLPANDSRDVAGEAPLGKALSPFVRAMSQQKVDIPNDNDVTDTTSSSDSSDSDNEED